MYEDNDLYNLNFDDESAGVDNEPNAQETQNTEPSGQAEPRASEPSAEQRANNADPRASAEQEKSQNSTQTSTQLSNEQLDYIERGRQREALIMMCDSIKQRIPDFDFEKIAPQILKMQPEQAKEYLSPLGLETLWLRSYGVNSHAVDGGREPSYDANDLMDKLSKGNASEEEELEFYRHLGRIARG